MNGSKYQSGNAQPVSAVLFDLDGTLVDSAPDLAAALNRLRSEKGLPALPLAQLRPVVGTGARGMLKAGLGVTPEHGDFENLCAQFLQFYAEGLLHQTVLFDGVSDVLAKLDEAGCTWGIVTNKSTRFAVPITQRLLAASKVLVCGDTTAHAKPHPEPLLYACRQLGLSPERVVYVGDDLRDVVAGRAAGMQTVAATWGYLGLETPVTEWGADICIENPHQLLKWLDLA